MVEGAVDVVTDVDVLVVLVEGGFVVEVVCVGWVVEDVVVVLQDNDDTRIIRINMDRPANSTFFIFLLSNIYLII